MTKRKSTDYKLTTVNYYLVEDKTYTEWTLFHRQRPRSGHRRTSKRYSAELRTSLRYTESRSGLP